MNLPSVSHLSALGDVTEKQSKQKESMAESSISVEVKLTFSEKLQHLGSFENLVLDDKSIDDITR